MSGKRCKIGGKLVLITNMSFRLVPKSVTLNDLERRSGPYFALFHRIRVRCRRKTIISVSKYTFDIVYDHMNTICAIIQRLSGQNNL